MKQKLLNISLLFFAVFCCDDLASQVFENVANDLGIDASTISSDHWGSGISFYDFNQDGWDDLTFTMENDTQVFYINNEGVFEKANFEIYTNGRAKHLLWVDYDNDGDLDIILSVYDGICYLYQNDGNFNFTDVTEEAGLYNFPAKNYGVSAADYNKDGFLDIFVTRYELFDNGFQPPKNVLYKNNGDGTFTDVSESAGVTDDMALSFMGVWLDYNNDSWPDLYIINDRSSGNNMLYENKGDGTFKDVAQDAGVGMNGEDPMTASVADFDNDGDLDIFTSNTSIFYLYRPKLFENQGDSTFLERANYYGVDFENTSWGGLWVDYNNDGNQDLYVATSFLNPNTSPIRNFFFRNNLSSPFTDITNATFVGNHISKSYAVARGDFDNNGFYDIAVHNITPYKPFLWQNSGNNQKYIKLTLNGTISNKMAIGSEIRVFVNNRNYFQYVHCGENYIGQNSQHHIFGAKLANVVDSVVITYPSGIVDKYYNLPTNNTYSLFEGETNRPEIQVNGDTQNCLGDSVFLYIEDNNLDSIYWNTTSNSEQIMVTENGFYWATVFKDGFSFISDTVNIGFNTQPDITTSVSEVSCFGFNDASIVLNFIDNNNEHYTVIWDENIEGLSIDSLNIGIYNFTIVDSIGCSFEDSIVITQPSSINVQINTTQPSILNDFGSIQYLINGGTPPYAVLLNGNLIETNSSIDSLQSGDYLLEIFDSNECYLNEDIVIENLSPTSILENNKIINLYPIPVKDYLVIENSFNNIFKIELYSINGSKILTTNKKEISMQHLNDGMYYVVIYMKHNTITKKVLLLK